MVYHCTPIEQVRTMLRTGCIEVASRRGCLFLPPSRSKTHTPEQPMKRGSCSTSCRAGMLLLMMPHVTKNPLTAALPKTGAGALSPAHPKPKLNHFRGFATATCRVNYIELIELMLWDVVYRRCRTERHR